MSLRVASESSREPCSGRLEVFYNGAWGSIGKSGISATTLEVACQQLGCGDNGTLSPVSSDNTVPRQMWVDNVQCPKGPNTLWQCPSSPWKQRPATLEEETWVTCHSKIRLQGGNSTCSGRVELWHRGSWGTVCDDSWDIQDAHVVCKQLGCGPAVDALKEAAFGQGTGPIWRSRVECRGNESSLWDCPPGIWGHSDCGHKEDAAVRCLENTGSKGPPSATGHSSVVAVGILGFILLVSLIVLLLWALKRRQRQRLTVFTRGENSVHQVQYREMNSSLKEDDLNLLAPSGDYSEVH